MRAVYIICVLVCAALALPVIEAQNRCSNPCGTECCTSGEVCEESPSGIYASCTNQADKDAAVGFAIWVSFPHH